MVLAWSQDRVGPICRTIEDCAMVFHAIHGVDEKDPGTVTTPFQFERRINLSSVRIGVVDNAPPELVNKLRDLGARPVPLGARPSTVGGGFGAESAAAFDSYVQMKARELGIDMSTIDAGSGGGGGGRGAGAAGAGAGGAGAGGAPGAAADSSAGRGRGAGGAPAGAAALNRWTNGRPGRAFDFINNQRRRHTLISQMQELLRDLDMYIPTASGDIGLHAQTGHPTAVVQYMFEAPAAGRGGGAGRGGAGRATAPRRAAPAPPPADHPQTPPGVAELGVENEKHDQNNL
jgi:hypothetical protein